MRKLWQLVTLSRSGGSTVDDELTSDHEASSGQVFSSGGSLRNLGKDGSRLNTFTVNLRAFLEQNV